MRARVVIPLCAATLAGCALVAGLEDHGRLPPAADGGADATLDAAREAEPEAGACPSGCCFIHVSADGKDSNSGCTQTEAKRTIAGAIGAKKTDPRLADAKSIRVCKGTYDESGLVLDVP